MIYCLTGDLLYTDPIESTAVIDCGGVGYHVSATATAMSRFPAPNPGGGVNVRVFTYLAVREDGVELYGFADEEELTAFKLLITVSGVGPKAAISILSVMEPAKLASAIAADDAKMISRAPGIGAKTAARVILELRDKMAKLYPSVGSGEAAGDDTVSAPAASAEDMKDAAEALAVLGYSRQEIAAVLGKAGGITGTEALIRFALGRLGR